MGFTTRTRGLIGIVAAGALALGMAACASSPDADNNGASNNGTSNSDDIITVGYVAVGPEGGWRDAHEKAVRDAFAEDSSFDLKYAPASSPTDQNSQINAFNTFVNDEVDAILLTATEASGWEDSLELAQEAEIPAILLDRGVDASEDLFATRIAPDNVAVAGQVRGWALSVSPEGANCYVLAGLPGLSVVDERNEGFEATSDGAAGWNESGAQAANWSADEGKSVTETVPGANDSDIQF